MVLRVGEREEERAGGAGGGREEGREKRNFRNVSNNHNDKYLKDLTHLGIVKYKT